MIPRKSMEYHRWRVEPDIGRQRIDAFISERLEGISRSQLKQRVKNLEINGQGAKLSKLIGPGDVVDLHLEPESEPSFEAQSVEFQVLFDDDRAVVVNKPQGLVVHPGAGNPDLTLVNGLMAYYQNKGGKNSFLQAFDQRDPSFRPGIVHRLDKDTSGVMITAADRDAHHQLSDLFARRKVQKTYLALVHGVLPAKKGRIETLHGRHSSNRVLYSVVSSGGKPAISEYQVMGSEGDVSLVLLKPYTGRTHQLRVHMAHVGCPMVGDPLYGPKKPDFTLMLHAYSLELQLPWTSVDHRWIAPLAQRFRSVMGPQLNRLADELK